jgi:outer membrane biosynthesis protein TonB
MRVCSYVSWAVVGALLLGFGCGGGETKPAESPDDTAMETEALAEDGSGSESPAAAPQSESGSEDAWEGEGDATSSGGDDAKGSNKDEDTRSSDVIYKLVKERRQTVRDCYEQARKEIPTLKGDVVIQFVIDPQGNVQKAELNRERSTLKSPVVVQCAIDVIKKIKFPASANGMETKANYPYNFTP